MTNDELKTAAERWGRKGIRSATYPEEETMYEIPRQRLLDAEHLADAYLARLAADEQREREDAEPITNPTKKLTPFVRGGGWRILARTVRRKCFVLIVL